MEQTTPPGFAFTKAQIVEQRAFVKDLEEGKADLFFTGSKLEAMALLSGLSKLCKH